MATKMISITAIPSQAAEIVKLLKEKHTVLVLRQGKVVFQLVQCEDIERVGLKTEDNGPKSEKTGRKTDRATNEINDIEETLRGIQSKPSWKGN